MDINSIPNGKNDKPVAVALSPPEFDIDEIDCPLYMFDHACSGSLMVNFTKDIAPDGYGTASIGGRILPKGTFTRLIFDRFQRLCLPVRGILTEYDSEAVLHLEGFRDTDGLEMEPQDFPVKVLKRRNDYPEKYRAHDEAAMQAAAESAVLLKNSGGALPLKRDAVLNLFGRGVAEYRTYAVGAGKINPRGVRSIVQAVKEKSGFRLNEKLAEFYAVPGNGLPDSSVLEEAAKLENTAVIIITRGSGENIDNRPDKGEYYLSDEEENLISKVSTVFEKTVAVLNIGYPIDVRWIDKYGIDAAVYTSFGGMFASEALMGILDGSINPSGRLPDTFALDYYDIPSSKNFLNFKNDEPVLQTDYPAYSDICYEEGMYVGYRYFTSFKKPVAYPFGYGLSYTVFEKSFSAPEIFENSLHISAVVKNTGNRAGKETVQLYIKKPDACMEQPAAELIDFAKTRLLAPGDTEEIRFNIPLSSFACYDGKKAEWVLLKGVYTVYSGEDAVRLSETGSFEIKDEETVKKVKNRAVFPLPFSEMSVKSGKSFPSGEKTAVHYDAADIPRSPRERHTPEFRFEKPEEKITFDMLKADPSLAGAFTAQLSDYELCRLNVCCCRDWRMDGKGEAGFIYSLEKYGMPDFAAADGNNGVNIKKHNIGMPSSTMVSATFDKEMAYKVGRVIAEEAVENNIRLLLGPAMNLHRNPLNGRNAEYFSEDPVLAGTMAGWQNKGFQDCGVAGCIKHIAANNCEALRKRSHSIMSERTLREIYLKPFMIAVGIEMPATVMTGYNALNGCFCDEDSELIHGILREEMGFDGFVMSDWNSYDTSDMCAMVNAGVSWLTPGSDSDERVLPLLEGLKAGKITREQLEENIYFLIKTMLKYV